MGAMDKGNDGKMKSSRRRDVLGRQLRSSRSLQRQLRSSASRCTAETRKCLDRRRRGQVGLDVA